MERRIFDGEAAEQWVGTSLPARVSRVTAVCASGSAQHQADGSTILVVFDPDTTFADGHEAVLVKMLGLIPCCSLDSPISGLRRGCLSGVSAVVFNSGKIAAITGR